MSSKLSPCGTPSMKKNTLIIALVFCASSLFAADPILPDLKITPAVYRKDLNQDQICNTKWGLDKRHVTPAMKKRVFELYGISHSRHSDFEVDHLVSRELGGADDI